ncbi:MAG: iron ABC transporter substrate-binding protein [Spirochaetia bacterium]
MKLSTKKSGSALRLLSALVCICAVAVPGYAGGGAEQGEEFTLYSGRGESLVAPLIEEFEEESGITVNVRYGGTAELAVLLQEEGDRSPADLFWGQDAGALGALSLNGYLQELPEDISTELPEIFRAERGTWVATSGRSRVLAYSPERTDGEDMPASVFDLTNERYAGRVGWAPTNGSFQAFVTAMRVELGESVTRDWLVAMRNNNAQVYRNNTANIEAIGAGEIDYAIVNNYYLGRFLATDPDFPAAQTTFESGDIGNLVNVASIGLLETSQNTEAALTFVRFLLDRTAQEYFTNEVNEYPVREDVEPNPTLARFEELVEKSPQVDLDQLEDLEGTLQLLQETDLL